MECNKDEAQRAISIAEEKLKMKDFDGAKKFVLKAQNLFPALQGISGMLTTVDVYSSSQKKLNGEVDWYAVLDVNVSADDDTIKKQYRKLALLVHPDKNKCVGAEDAFKLVGEAWNLLSDKAQRLAYNQRTNGFRFTASNAFQPTPPRASGFPSYHPSYTSAPNDAYTPFRRSGFPSCYPRHTNTHAPRPTPAHSYASQTNPVPNTQSAPNHTQPTPPSAQTSKSPPEPTPAKESGPHTTTPNTPSSTEIPSTSMPTRPNKRTRTRADTGQSSPQKERATRTYTRRKKSSVPNTETPSTPTHTPPIKRTRKSASGSSAAPKERVTRTYTRRKKSSVPNTETPSTPTHTPPIKRTRTSASGSSAAPKERVTRTYTKRNKSSVPNTESPVEPETENGGVSETHPSMESSKGNGIRDWERDEDDYRFTIAILKAKEDLRYIIASAGAFLDIGAAFEEERKKNRKLLEESSQWRTSCNVA